MQRHIRVHYCCACPCANWLSRGSWLAGMANTPRRWPKEARRWCGGVVGGCDLPIAARACGASPPEPSAWQFSGVQDLGNKKARRHQCRGLEFGDEVACHKACHFAEITSGSAILPCFSQFVNSLPNQFSPCTAKHLLQTSDLSLEQVLPKTMRQRFCLRRCYQCQQLLRRKRF